MRLLPSPNATPVQDPLCRPGRRGRRVSMTVVGRNCELDSTTLVAGRIQQSLDLQGRRVGSLEYDALCETVARLY